jgi:hypothetical protein
MSLFYKILNHVRELIVVIFRSIIIHHLRAVFRTKSVAVLFIFCNYKESTKQTIPYLVASLLRQISQHRDAASEDIRRLYTLHQRGGCFPSLDDVRTALASEIGTYSKVFVIVDALDECPEGETRESLIKELRALALTVRLLVTSRDIPLIARHFCDAIRLEISADDQDVQEYIRGQIGQAARRPVRELRERVIAKVMEKAGGM